MINNRHRSVSIVSIELVSSSARFTSVKSAKGIVNFIEWNPLIGPQVWVGSDKK